MKLAIGLPKFLLESTNAVPALVISFILILVLIPGIFFYLYSNSTSKDDSKILADSIPIYQALLNENLIFMNLPKILSLTTSF